MQMWTLLQLYFMIKHSPAYVLQIYFQVSQAGNLEKVMQLVNSGVSVESADDEVGIDMKRK